MMNFRGFGHYKNFLMMPDYSIRIAMYFTTENYSGNVI